MLYFKELCVTESENITAKRDLIIEECNQIQM